MRLSSRAATAAPTSDTAVQVSPRPELQPDGSIQFWQLSLTVESDDFVGWGEGITYTPDTAVPPSCGWNPPKRLAGGIP